MQGRHALSVVSRPERLHLPTLGPDVSLHVVLLPSSGDGHKNGVAFHGLLCIPVLHEVCNCVTQSQWGWCSAERVTQPQWDCCSAERVGQCLSLRFQLCNGVSQRQSTITQRCAHCQPALFALDAHVQLLQGLRPHLHGRIPRAVNASVTTSPPGYRRL